MVYPIDRELVLDFAGELDVDGVWLSDLIDGKNQAGPVLARALALKTGTPDTLWTEEGCDPQVRLVALKVWGGKHRRRLSEESGEPFRPYGRCALCD